MNLSELNLDIRAFNAVCRAGFKTAEELFQAMGENQERVRLLVGRSNFDRIDEAFAELEDKGMLEFTTKLPPAPAEATTPEYLAAFNLNAKIHYCKDSVERGLAEMCIGIEQMHSEKQYKVLGYQNFEDYCQQEFGFTKQQGIKYVNVGKMLTEQNDNSSCHFEELGINKLHLLSKLDEQTREVVTETMDVESVTVKELKAEIETLQRKNDKLESETADLGQQLDAAKENINRQNRSFVENMQEKNKQLSEAQITVSELEKRIRELEEQPIDHVMTDADTSEEIEKLRQELEDEKLRAETIKKQADALKDEQERKRMDLMNRHEQDMKKLREGYEKQIADAGIDDESKRKIEDEAYIKALTQQFEDVVNVLEEWIEDLPPDDVLRHMKHIDEYYRKNLRYLMYQKGVED